MKYLIIVILLFIPFGMSYASSETEEKELRDELTCFPISGISDFARKFENLKKVKLDGIQKKLMGIKLDIKEISLSGSLDLKDENGNIIGELRSACYSPHFEKVIGIAMMKKPYCDVSQIVKVDVNGNICTGNVCDLPFI